MRLIAYILLGSVLLFRGSCSAEHRGIAALKSMLADREKESDIGRACLTMATDVFPHLNVAEYDQRLDAMVKRISHLARGISDPEQRIGLLNTYFFQPGWWNDSHTYTYDLEDLDAKRLDNRYLNGYLDTRKGSCITMSMLYLIVTNRLGWGVAPVRAAKHVFCRYLSPGFQNSNIEPTCGGGYLSDSQYVAMGKIPDRAIRNGVYLRALSSREYIATLMSNHAIQLISLGRNKEARAYLELAISTDSTLSSAYWNLGCWYEGEGRIAEANRAWYSAGHMPGAVTSRYCAETYKANARVLKSRAQALGIVHRFPGSFAAEQKKAIDKFKRTGQY